jgi:hypothetical protein
MADEATIQSSLIIKKTTSSKDVIDHKSMGPTTFKVTVTGTKGPAPGTTTITTEGVNITFTGFTTPGLCEFHNQDATNFVEGGIWDPDNNKFFPLFEIGPGEKYVLKLSRNLQEEFWTGTGTTGAAVNRLRLKADTASCEVYVGAFES